MQFNPKCNIVVSVDESGMMEYWRPSFEDESKGFTTATAPDVAFELKSETDLYEFKKAKCAPKSLTFAHDYSNFATYSMQDRQVRIFKFSSGKLIRKYDESLDTITEMQQAGTAFATLEEMEFGRRLSTEKEMETDGGGQVSTSNVRKFQLTQCLMNQETSFYIQLFWESKWSIS